MSGSLFIVAAPSGAGKTTIVKGLLAADARVKLSVSHTTRAPRPGEVDGRDYHFVSQAQFAAMREADQFLEWAQVHGNFYGTSRAWLAGHLAAGHDVLVEIDWQGARQVRAAFPQAVSVFVLPPSMAELERRLRGRASDAEAVIRRRLANAEDEIRCLGEFDYVIINNELQESVADLLAIVRASRLRREAQWSECRTRFGKLLSEE